MSLESKLENLTALERKMLEEKLDSMVLKTNLDTQSLVNTAYVLHTLICSKDHEATNKGFCNFYKGLQKEGEASDFTKYIDLVQNLMKTLAYTEVENFTSDLSSIAQDVIRIETYEYARQSRLFIAVFMVKYLGDEDVLSKVSDALTSISELATQFSELSEDQEDVDK